MCHRDRWLTLLDLSRRRWKDGDRYFWQVEAQVDQSRSNRGTRPALDAPPGPSPPGDDTADHAGRSRDSTVAQDDLMPERPLRGAIYLLYPCTRGGCRGRPMQAFIIGQPCYRAR